jgi:asparagine synthase (glutamine-hydrolysing)
MLSSDKNVAITFNGEIYNFLELHNELQAKGFEFRSHCDTEVLLATYLEYGTACLDHLNGIYAFAIWDARASSLFLARDGFGVKPLYIAESNGIFTFASEIKALLCFPWIERKLDPQAIAHYLRLLWCPAPRTPLAGVKKLEPGEALVVHSGRVTKRWRHYDLPSPEPDRSRSAPEWTADIRHALSTAVQRQMVSDVPLGAFLSGGLDSSAIVAYARQYSAERLQCFTIDFDKELAKKEGFDRDLPYAQRVAKHLDIDLHVVNVNANLADGLEEMVWQLDEPLADFSALNVMMISQLARKHGIKVLLSGAGGDDLFSGYRRHRALGLDDVWDRTPRLLRDLASKIGGQLPGRPPVLRRVGKLLSSASLEGDERLVSYFNWAAPGIVIGLLSPESRKYICERPLMDAVHEMPESATPLQRMLLLEQRYFLSDHNLNYTDKMSMAVGIEVRVPFLDPDLVSLAAQIPDRYKQRGAEGKWILKKAMEELLPKDVIYRSKTGFIVPLRTWLAGPLRSVANDLLSGDSVQRRGLFDADAVTRLMRENDQGKADYAYIILSMMCIEIWCRRFLDERNYPHAA